MTSPVQEHVEEGFPFWQRIGLIAGPVAAALIFLFADLTPGNPVPTRTAAVAALMAIWWITDALPLAVTSFLPIILFPVLGVMDAKAASAEYVNDTIFLFIGGFLVAIAMERWNLHRRIALRILVACGMRPQMILFSFLASTAFISMWISNTAAAMMMVPIALAILLHLEESCGRAAMAKFSAGVMLAVAYGASIGGLATLVGTPPNLVFARIYQQQFPDQPMTFARWFAFGFPFALMLKMTAWAWLAWRFRADPKAFASAGVVLESEYAALGPMRREEMIIAAVFVVLSLLWLTREPIPIGSLTVPGWSQIKFGETTLLPQPKFVSDGTVAMALAFVLFLIPAAAPAGDRKPSRILDARSIAAIPWSIVLLFGGGFALAKGIEVSGLSDWIRQCFESIGHLPPFVVVLVVSLAVTFLTELTSNTATATILMPILAANSKALGVDPWLLMVPGVITCSYGFMLPVGTPPNAIVFGTGRVRLPDMVKSGFFMDLAGVVLIVGAIFTLGKWAFG